MTQLGLETEILNQELVNATVARLRQAKVVLPTFSQLQDPSTIPHSITEMLKTCLLARPTPEPVSGPLVQ